MWRQHNIFKCEETRVGTVVGIGNFDRIYVKSGAPDAAGLKRIDKSGLV